MHSLRHLFLVIALLTAQWVAAAHGVEHGLGKEKNVGGHVCELCLAAHDLGAALPGSAALPAVAPPDLPPDTVLPVGRVAPSVFQPRQGAPPRF